MVLTAATGTPQSSHASIKQKILNGHAVKPASVELLNLRTADSATFSLKDEVIKGLADGQARVVPGELPDDEAYAFCRSIPTLALYSDRGLAIYEQITNLDYYYPFPAELEILKEYGLEIASRMFGLPSQVLTEENMNGGTDDEPSQAQDERDPRAAPKEKWGDASVGVNNHGVNGGLSMDASRVGLAIELGSGSLQKTRHLLKALSKLIAAPASPFDSIEYRAMDVESESLVSTLLQLATQESEFVTLKKDTTSRVVASGITATYDEGLAYLAQNKQAKDTKKSLIWLGSSIGNLDRTEAADFLKNIGENVMQQGDTMLIGIDGCADGERIGQAYNDPLGVTRRFIMEGVDHAGRTLHGVLSGTGGLMSKNFKYISRWNAQIGRHEAYVECLVDNLVIPMPGNEAVQKITLKKGEMLAIEVSYKYSPLEARALFDAAGLRLVQQWTDSRQLHSVYLIEKPSFYFPLIRSLGQAPAKNPYGIPSLAEWETMWKFWDNLTMSIIPRDILMTKPIPLRHIILFYTGHIPAFAGIHLSRYFKEDPIEPAKFSEIFERGIDPNVDTQITTHSHSAVPQKECDWPSITSIMEFQGRVRQRIRRVYSEEGERMTRRLSRVMAMIFEHEAMHAETLVYIAVQAPKLNPSPGRLAPDFESLSRHWDRQVKAEGPARHGTISFEATSVAIGHNDNDQDDDEAYDSEHALGWDVEHPRRQVDVQSFKIDKVPITNQQYLQWLSTQSAGEVPDLFLSSWASKDEKPSTKMQDITVKTLYGRVPFEFAKHWPAVGSACQLGAFAKSKGGRLPTQGELSVFLRANPVDSATGNVGLRDLHPLPPVTPHQQRDGAVGFGSDGGVWMWVSDQLEAHDGFVPSSLYPGYSSDFHDGTHQLVLGGSYATPPRVARESFVNWYQAKYRFVVAGARVTYDA